MRHTLPIAGLLLTGCPEREMPERTPPSRAPIIITDADEAGSDGRVELQGVLRVDGEQVTLEKADGEIARLSGITDVAPWHDRRDRTVTVSGTVDVGAAASALVFAVDGLPRTHQPAPGAFVPVRDDEAWLGRAGGGRRFVVTPLEGPLGPGHPVVIGLISVDGDRLVAAVVDDGEAIRHPLEPSWALVRPVGTVLVDADEDVDLELVFMGEWMTGIGPQGAEPQPYNIVLDFTGDSLRQLAEVEALIADAPTPDAIRSRIDRMRKQAERPKAPAPDSPAPDSPGTAAPGTEAADGG